MKVSAVKAHSKNYPTCSPILRWLGGAWLRLFGWRIEGSIPDAPKFVAIYAPHTSNWDGFLILPAAFAVGIKFNFLAKKELFVWPIGMLISWIGGIPVDRHSRKDLVGQIVAAIEEREKVAIGVAPEGTRRYTEYWKTGFYHITQRAEVPLCFAYLDYERKVAGFDEGMLLSGDMDKDMEHIRGFYSKAKPKHPENFGQVAFKPKRRTKK
ncbi:MAG: lysophospholipid acyltransferase family protein [Chloroflexi bacterium]|nr:lysophospholipid acyltransferase family protein [Chloroflexota bacterium]